MDTDLIEEHLRQADAVLSLLELALDGGGQAPGVDTIVGAVQAAATNVRKARELVLDDSPGLPPATP